MGALRAERQAAITRYSADRSPDLYFSTIQSLSAIACFSPVVGNVIAWGWPLAAKVAFKVALTSLAQLFMVHETGPYLEGKQATYADLIVGGWLNMLSATMPEEEWKDFRTWHSGVFARLHDALQENYFECK